MKKIEEILFIVQARLGSTRCKNKMIRPFAGSSLTELALKKLKKTSIPRPQLYLSAYEEELKQIAKKEEINIFHRSKESAEWAGDSHLTGIFEWWDKLPFKYVVMINACCPLLEAETIDRFIQTYLSVDNKAMFGVIRKKNYIWDMSAKILNAPSPSNAPDTKKVNSFYEAAHCLYAGLMEDIGKNIWMGDFSKQGDILFYEVPEKETFDIDYEWEFTAYESIYREKIATKKGEIL